MAKRTVSLLLVLVMLAGVLPLSSGAREEPDEAVAAEPVTTDAGSAYGEGSAELSGLINPSPMWLQEVILSGAGAASMDTWASGEYLSIYDPDGGEMSYETLKGRLMLRAMHFNGYGGIPRWYYLPKNTAGSVHELILFGKYDLAASDVSIGGVTVLSGPEKHVYGDEGGEMYWYSAKVMVPADDTVLTVDVNGEPYAEIPVSRVSGTSPVALFSTFAVYDYKENGDDPEYLDSMTLQISGFSLPDDPAAYNLVWRTSDPETGEETKCIAPASAITEEDEVGYRYLTYDFSTVFLADKTNRKLVKYTDGVKGMDLMWSDLTIGKITEAGIKWPQSEYDEFMPGNYRAYFFGADEHLTDDRSAFRGSYQEEELSGGYVTLPVPYYSLYYQLPPGPEVRPTAELEEYIPQCGFAVTHDGTVSLTIHPGSYAGGEVQVRSAGNVAVDWTPAEEGRTLSVRLCDWEGNYSPDYGDFGLRVVFRGSSLRNYGVSRAVYYNSGEPSTLTDGRLIDCATGDEAPKNGDGAYVLKGNADSAYRLEADIPYGWGGDVDLIYPEKQTVLCEFYDDDGVLFTRQMDNWSEDDRRWSLEIKLGEIMDARGVRIYNDGSTCGFTKPGGALDIELSDTDAGVLRALLAPTVDNELRIGADGKKYRAVKIGSELTAAFEASSGDAFTRSARIQYRDVNGELRTVPLEGERFGKRSYRVSFAIPYDAASLAELRYTLTDTGTGESSDIVYDLSDYRVAADMHFTGFPETLVGATFRIRTAEGGVNGAVDRSVVLTGENISDLNLGDLPEDVYEWEVSGKSGHITGVAAGSKNTAPLLLKRGSENDLSGHFDGLQLCSLTVNTTGFTSAINGQEVNPTAAVSLTVRTPDLQTHTVLGATGVKMEQIPKGSSVTVALSYEDELGEISSCTTDGPGAGAFSLDGDQVLEYTYHPFTYRTVSGHIWATKTVESGPLAGMSYGYVPWQAVVVLTQEVNRGGKTETHTLTARPAPAASGKPWDAGYFSFLCYDNVPVKIEVRSMSWKTETRTVTAPGNQTLADITLEPGGEQIITVSAETVTPESIWEDGSYYYGESGSVKTSVDAGFLTVGQIGVNGSKHYNASSGAFETYSTDGKIVVKINDGIITEGDAALWVYAAGNTETGDMRLSVPYTEWAQQVVSDGKGGLTAVYNAKFLGGELRGTVVPPDDPNMTGFLIFKTAVGRASFVSGKGELHLGYSVGDVGQRQVLTLMVADEDVGEMATLLTDEFDKVLAEAETWRAGKVRTILTRTVNLADGCYVYLKDGMQPSTPIRGELLSPWRFDYYFTLGTGINTVEMVGTLSKRFPDTPDQDYLQAIKVFTRPNSADRASIYFTVEGEAADLATDITTHTDSYVWNVKRYTHAENYQPTQVTVISELPMLSDYNCVKFDVEVYHSGGLQTLKIQEEIPMFQLGVPTTVSLYDQMAAQKLSNAPAEKQANWTLNVSLRAFVSETEEENEITIWDNGVAVDTFTISPHSYNTISRRVRLTDNLVPGVHVMWATRTFRGETMTTQPSAFNLIHEAVDQVYISDLRWTHYNHRRSDGQPDYFYFRSLSEMAGKTFWIWPGKRSDLSLILHNAYSSEVEGVSILVHRKARPAPAVQGAWPINNYNAGMFTGIPAYDDVFHFTCTANDTASHTSTWTLTDVNLGWFEWFQFQVDMKYEIKTKDDGLSEAEEEELNRQNELIAGYRANGLGDVPDDTQMVDALAVLTKDQLEETLGEKSVYLPDQLRGLDFKVTKNTGTDYEVKLSAPTDEVKDYRLTVHEGGEIDVDDVWDLMEYEREHGSKNPDEAGWSVFWAELDGMQGSTLIRMAVSNEKDAGGNYALTMHKTAYITAEVASAIKNGTSLEAAAASEEAQLAGLYDKGDPPANWKKKTYDVTSYVYTTSDLGQDLYVSAVKGTYTSAKEAEAAGKAAKFIPKRVGDTMNVLGVVDAAISIRSGPSGNDTNGLYCLLNNVKDQKFRNAIEQQLRDYDKLRMDIYAQDTAISAIGAGANFVPDPTPLTKIVCFLGSLGNSTISGWAKDYNRQVYNTTLLDIQRQIKLEQYKAIRAQADVDFKNMIRRRFGKDVADNERRLREEKKLWYLSVDEFGDYKWRLRENVPEFNTYQDPSGFVFEAVEENRIEGVTATLYYSETADGSYSVWADPNADETQRQDNPLSTTQEGRYQWMVPSGWWKVRYEKEGYLAAESKPMNVPPMHTAVDIGLLSTEAPTASVTVGADGKVTVLFSKYMQLESLIRLFGGESYEADIYDASAFAVQFFNADGDPVRGTVTFPDKRANTGYVDGVYMQDVIASEYFVRTTVFTPRKGESARTWLFADGIVSYSGTALNTQGQAAVYLAEFDPNGGTLSRKCAVTDEDGRLISLPEPVRENYIFEGWFAPSGERVTADTALTSDTKLTARWTGECAVEFEQNGSTLTVKASSGRADALTCYIAVYGAGGRQLCARRGTLLGSLTQTVDLKSLSGADCVKAFMTAADGAPVDRPYCFRLSA